MDGSLNWHAPKGSTECTDEPSSHLPPKDWSDLKTALLDRLVSSNSVDESARSLANFETDPAESVASYALRYQSECKRFEACVQRSMWITVLQLQHTSECLFFPVFPRGSTHGIVLAPFVGPVFSGRFTRAGLLRPVYWGPFPLASVLRPLSFGKLTRA